MSFQFDVVSCYYSINDLNDLFLENECPIANFKVEDMVEGLNQTLEGVE